MDSIPSNNNQEPQPFASSLTQEGQHQVPEIALPKGGGGLKGIDEKLDVNPVTGTSGMSIPFPVSPARGGFSPSLSISYSSGGGNGVFGLGWGLNVPSIQRKTNKTLPEYKDGIASDTFILAGAEDLVPKLEQVGNVWEKQIKRVGGYTIQEYRPRIEGSWLRIEQWKEDATGILHWRTISPTNITSVYGDTPLSRISNPEDKLQTFEWKLSHSYDNLGNVIVYEYKEEDLKGVSPNIYERNRHTGNITNRYLKRVHYGNEQAYFQGDALPAIDNFLFEVVLDYGDHSSTNMLPSPNQLWSARRDAFSNFRAGFDIRTYRLCKRVLLFHKFSPANQTPSELLVKALELTYQDYPEANPSAHPLEGFTYLKAAQIRGYSYESNGYTSKTLPPLEFYYQGHAWDARLKELETYEQMPVGINQGNYQWIDFYGEGISGLLSQENQAWYYKENLGAGEFSSAKILTTKPNFLKGQFQDLEGNGTRQWVNYEQSPQGFFEQGKEEDWNSFRYFENLPNRNWSKDPYARFIDLNGDGRADILLTTDDVFQWHASKGKAGFGAANKVYTALDEEEGPRIVFADQEQSIFLADMTGDGLTDIVRIRNGEVCYWANKGYGHFSAKITMGNAPHFDHEEQFNATYLHLLDIDGSGTTDLAYYHKNSLQIWCNWSGNEFVEAPKIIVPFPSLAGGARLDVVDLLGTGTSCLVWSSSHSKDKNIPLKYLHLTAGRKPHLLYSYKNNLGASTELSYSPSTKFYLTDKKAGRPWATRLPFPVHVVERVSHYDHIQETIFTQSYHYRHGYYDRIEREFRGFGCVETLDTATLEELLGTGASNVQEAHYQVPIKTVSWYHTGAALEEKSLLAAYKEEYSTNALEQEIPSSLLPADLDDTAYLEAHRALKGLALRQEIYCLDTNDLEGVNDIDAFANFANVHPYSTSQQHYQVKIVQAHAGQAYASFVVLPQEQWSYVYERNPQDPRISHELVLSTDELGIPTETASVLYPRLQQPNGLPWMVEEAQQKLHLIYRKIQLTNDINTLHSYRLRTAYEEQVYEVLQASPRLGERYFTIEDLKQKIDNALLLDYIEEADPTNPSTVYKRLHGHTKVQLLADDLSAPLPIGVLSSLGIPYKTYQLAYTAQQLSSTGGFFVTGSGDNLLQNLPPLSDLGYVDLEGNGNWWLHSGTSLYNRTTTGNFYMPIGVEDILGNQSHIQYDSYHLLPIAVTDVLGNTSRVSYDYRVLQPNVLTDLNDNQSAVLFDELGIVVRSAILGKQGSSEGDSLEHPTAKMEYDFYNYKNNGKPNYIYSQVREQHYDPTIPTVWQESYEYSNGSGVVLMSKVQTKDGSALQWHNGTLTNVDTSNLSTKRWIGNGRTVVNNKGLPIKQYEPYFSVTHDYESAAELVEIGYSPTLYYDAAGRNHRTELADGSIVRVEYDSWSSKSYDNNDTIRESSLYKELSVGEQALVEGSTVPTVEKLKGIWQAIQHADTPSTVYLDVLGRTIYTREEQEAGIEYAGVWIDSDLAGRYSEVHDQLSTAALVQQGAGNYTSPRGKSSRSKTNLLGQGVYSWTALKGEHWMLLDGLGRLVCLWKNPSDYTHGVIYTTDYDAAHRPLKTYVQRIGGSKHCFSKTEYGESITSRAVAQSKNLLGQVYKSYDQSGVATTEKLDFKGNPLKMSRRLTREYAQTIDWDGIVDLETEVYSTTSRYDALNRPTETTLPDGSILYPRYNAGGYMESLGIDVLGRGTVVNYLEGQDYNAKGQQERIRFGNGTVSRFLYDASTFRLSNLLTVSGTEELQDLQYTYDPVGNVVSVRDEAQSTYYYNNRAVSPRKNYEYDALYRLTKATGRQHAGANTLATGQKDYYFPLPSHSIQSAVSNYIQRYTYDEVGNITHMNQVGAWTREYNYGSDATNRLLSTKLSGQGRVHYQYDAYGNMLGLPHLQAMRWNHQDELVEVELDRNGQVAYYVYDGGGQRIRKVLTKNGKKQKERLYMGDVECYREYDMNEAVVLERWTLQVEGIVQVDTLTKENRHIITIPVPVVRYQYRDYLGSSVAEANELGQVISYEEYYPYGSSAYQVSSSSADLSLKRYRFTGKERDEETGLDYFGVRYYASWLGRWTSGDPGGFIDGLNLYRYVRNNPVNGVDNEGYSTEVINEELPQDTTVKINQDDTIKPHENLKDTSYYKVLNSLLVNNDSFKKTTDIFWQEETRLYYDYFISYEDYIDEGYSTVGTALGKTRDNPGLTYNQDNMIVTGGGITTYLIPQNETIEGGAVMNDLGRALVIIHEAVHAEINAKSPIPLGLQIDHHRAYTKQMHEEILVVLIEFNEDNELGVSKEDLSLIAWNGLQGTQAFVNEFKMTRENYGDELNKINNRINKMIYNVPDQEKDRFSIKKAKKSELLSEFIPTEQKGPSSKSNSNASNKRRKNKKRRR